MQNPHFQRGAILLQQHRHDLAELEFRQALADDPEDALAHAFLSISLRELDRQAEGVAEAQLAIHNDPQQPLAHYALALNLLDQKKHAAALAACAQAIQLDPHDADLYAALAAIHLTSERFRDGLAAADRGLQCDPKSLQCQNLRAMALRSLGRSGEAQVASGQVLAEAPEDATAHAVHAWNHLEQGRVADALAHFSESLRLDPNNEFARRGMVEALKARYRVYRWFFGFRVWQARLGRQSQWMLLVGLLVFVRVSSEAGNKVPELKLPANILLGLYLGFVFLSWAGTPLSNFLLRLNRFGRRALNRQETWEANVVGGCLLAALACLVTAIVSEPYRYVGLGGIAMFLAVILPIAGAFRSAPGWPRWAMGGLAALAMLWALGSLASAAAEETWGDPIKAVTRAGDGMVALLFMAAAATWLSAILPKRN